MKRFFVFVCLAASVTLYAQSPQDPVVVTVAGKPVTLSEFMFMAQKNSEVDLSDPKSAEQYVELYTNFKLKVADAEALNLDQTKTFKDDYEEYKGQLTAGFLSDKNAEEAAVKAMYDLGNTLPDVSHIMFRLPSQKYLGKDTLAVYQKAMAMYERLKKGEDIDEVGPELFAPDGSIAYERIYAMQPMSTLKEFENAVYGMKAGELSLPVRTSLGYHLIQVHGSKLNLGSVQVARILIGYPENATDKQQKKALADAKKVYKLVEKGGDFAILAKTYSTDTTTAKNGGVLPFMTQGVLEPVLDEIAFSLVSPGDVSGLIETADGYQIIKLVGKKARPSFDSQKASLMRRMAQSDYNFELYASFDNKLRKESGYVFYPEAYSELEALCNDYFPDDKAFFDKAKEMKKPLLTIYGDDIPQSDFAYYMYRQPFSTKAYAGDFMQEVYNLFVREMLTNAERKNMDAKHPEIKFLLQEYRDGTLLFEVSNQKVWSKPAADQKALEEQWVKELKEKYPVEVNWDVLKPLYKK